LLAVIGFLSVTWRDRCKVVSLLNACYAAYHTERDSAMGVR